VSGLSVSLGIPNFSSLALQDDGSIVVCGFSFFGKEIYLRRLTSDGRIDSSFGLNGTVISSFGLEFHNPRDIAIQEDEKIVITGTSSFTGNVNDIFLARYNTDGSLDSSFGDKSGWTLIPRTSHATTITIQPDTKILIAGSTRSFTNTSQFFLARFDRNGIIDSSFGIDGIVKTDFDNEGDFINNIALQPDGKIVAVGIAYFSDGPSNKIPYIAIARYLPDGTLDSEFGEGGKVKLKLAEYAEGFGVGIQPNGKIVISGYTSKLKSNYVVARYLSNGVLDSTFGENGVTVTDLGGNDDRGYELVIQNNGRIVVRGTPGITLAGYTGDRPGIITKIKRWIRKNILNFTSTNDGSAAYYAVEQSSGAGFTTVKQIKPGKTGDVYSYPLPQNTNATYRIKAVQQDGSVVYSDAISAGTASAGSISIVPNPAKDFISISGLQPDKICTINITNHEGKTVLVKNISAAQKIDISHLPKGIYFIRIQQDDEVRDLKWMKE
jgi:uncharacterized delta-60 repeat protein